MIINGRGYVCQQCRRDLISDDITYYGDVGDVASTNCCRAKVVKKNWFDKFMVWLCRK